MTETVPVSDWNRLLDSLHDWAGDADVTATDERASVAFATAQFTVHRDGRVTAGMPLHDIDAAASTLRFDEDAIHVRGEGLAYTFTRP